MKTIQFNIHINAPVKKVYDAMLGLTNKLTYEQWTSEFSPGSTYEGTWEKGSKILFLGPGESGKQSGMVSEIAENTPNFVSIKHYGILKDGVEIIEGPDVDKWAGGLENYTFKETNGGTEVTVDVDMTEEFEGYMNDTYPKALKILKEICEK